MPRRGVVSSSLQGEYILQDLNRDWGTGLRRDQHDVRRLLTCRPATS